MQYLVKFDAPDQGALSLGILRFEPRVAVCIGPDEQNDVAQFLRLHERCFGTVRNIREVIE